MRGLRALSELINEIGGQKEIYFISLKI